MMAQLLLLAVWLLGGDALAAYYSIEVCVKLDNDFVDGAYGDNWANVNGTVKVRGAYVGFTAYSGATLISTDADYTDPTTGCVTRSLWDGYQHEIWMQTKARLDGDIYVEVYDDDNTPALYTYFRNGPANRYVPTQNQTGASALDFVVPFETETAQLAVGTYIVYRSNFGLGADTYLKYDNSGCCYGSGPAYIRAATGHKSLIAHETGHRIARIRDGNHLPVVDYTAGVDGCDGYGNGDNNHFTFTKEWAGAALKEGFADFIAAWAFNDREDDCEFWMPHRIDIDLDGTDDVDPDGIISCEGIPLTGLDSFVTARDWLIDAITEGAGGCGGASNGRSSDFDVLRYYWDMYTDELVDAEVLLDAYEDADPQDWNLTWHSITFYDNLFFRLYVASDDNGILTEHEAQLDNGVQVEHY